MSPTRSTLFVLPALALGTVLACPALAGQEVTLTRAVEAALAHHPSVAAARAAVEGAEASVDAASAARLPSVAVSSGLTRFQEPMVVAPLHGFDPTQPPDFDRTLIQSRLGVDYTLFDGGARGAGIDAARGRSGMAGARLDEARAALMESTAAAWLGLLSAREVREAAAARVEALEAERDRTAQGFEQGTEAQVSVLRAEAALADARATETGTAATVELARARLARLTGVAPGEVASWTLPPPALPDGAAPAGDGLPPSTPPLDVARHAVAAARARLEAAQATRLPALRGSAGLVNYASGSGEAATEWQAGLELSWPVFTGGSRGAAIEQARAELAAAEEELRLAQLEQGDRADAATAELAGARSRVEALATSVVQWEEVSRIEALRLAQDAGVQSDLLQAQAGLFQARAGLSRARNEVVLARVRLARALGELTPSWFDTELETQP